MPLRVYARDGSIKTTISTAPVNLATDVTGTLPVGNGGTGAASLTAHGAVVVNAGGTAQTTVAPGASGNVLTSDGTDWTSAAASGGTADDTSIYIGVSW